MLEALKYYSGRLMKGFFYGLFLLFFIGVSIWYPYLQWQECKKMKHSTLYCVGHVFR